MEWIMANRPDWTLGDWEQWEDCRHWDRIPSGSEWNWERYERDFKYEGREPTACIWKNEEWDCTYSWCDHDPEDWPPGVENSPDFHGCANDDDEWECDAWDFECQANQEYEDDEEVCEEDDWFCVWQDSDEFRDCEYTWDDDHQCWDNMAEYTGCNSELVCDFFVCEENEQDPEHTDCWREDCHSDCGEYECALWHYDYDAEDWIIDQCEEQWDPEADKKYYGRVIVGFQDTFAAAFNEFCDENCVQDTVQEVTATE
jgi:hypothetical protein